MDGDVTDEPGAMKERYSSGAVRSENGLVGERGIVGIAQSKRTLRRGTALAIAVVILSAAFIGALSLTGNSQESDEVAKANPLFMQHAPIMIEGDSGLTAANGVTGGSGTSSDPFVIEGWDIDASGSDLAGIAISNLTHHIIVKHIYVHSGGMTSFGILAANLTNCTIERCVSTENYAGIVTILCDDVVIRNNTVANNSLEGILVTDGINATVANNLVASNTGLGIALFSSNESRVENNTMSHNGDAGLALEFTEHAHVSGNTMDYGSNGLVGVFANGSLIEDNRIWRCLSLGVLMTFCTNNTIVSNVIADSTIYGIQFISCSNNTIYHNEFMGNYLGASTQPQASDDSTANRWNASYPVGGNFWSAIYSPDLNSGPNQDIPGSDGIVDNPLILDPSGTAEDHYPIASEFPMEIGVTAALNVVPAGGTILTNFTFDGSSSWNGTNRSQLEYRWDFEGDGIWDTGWGGVGITHHEYAVPGEYNATLEVRDQSGHTGNTTVRVEVDAEVIPEFPTLIAPALAVLAVLLAGRRLRRRGTR